MELQGYVNVARRPHRGHRAAQDSLLTIPRNAGRRIVEAGAAIARPLLGTDRFVKFCKERGLPIDRDRLLRLERLGVFGPVFRVRTPRRNARQMTIPPQNTNNWFAYRWAWDTTRLQRPYQIPDLRDRTQEAYYSIFQVDHLALVLSRLTLQLNLDGFMEAAEPIDWQVDGSRWLQFANAALGDLRMHEHRRALALLCQFISNRYYPATQGDQRTIQISHGHASDSWIVVDAMNWDWEQSARQWNPRVAARLFGLTATKLRNAYEALAIAQAHADPIEHWYQLTQFVMVRQRQRLKGDALRAETLRAAAHMLRHLYKDLYNDELPHPNEVGGTIITHVPELEVRRDVRRYLELICPDRVVRLEC